MPNFLKQKVLYIKVDKVVIKNDNWLMKHFVYYVCIVNVHECKYVCINIHEDKMSYFQDVFCF